MPAAEAALPPGLQKEITRHPPCSKHLPPQEGDEVQLHYVLKLKASGRQLASSKEQGAAFVHNVGQGQVVQGWELAVRTMRKGEHARFTIAPQLAYGEAGDEELGVPPDSTVVLELELIKCPVREDLFEDGSAIKLIVKEGPDGRFPGKRDEVQITYKVTLHGGGGGIARQKIVYQLGSTQSDQIARVLDKALLTMKRGDEVIVTYQPKGAVGSGDNKSQSEVAMISVALEEIFEVHDTSIGDLDKTVLRKRIKEGEGTDRIHDTAKVTIQVASVSANAEQILSDRRDISFTAGDGDVCDALEGSVLGMRKGDEAVLRCESAEACAGGLLGLPSNLETPIMIHIIVVSFDKVKEKWDLSASERIERGRKRKAVASELFKRGRTRLAAKHYEAIADLFTKLDFFRLEEEQREAAQLRRVANLNRAMCMLKLGNMASVKALCTSVLSEDACNPKALFRRAKAEVAVKEYEEAIVDLERLLEIEPDSVDGRQLLREAKRKQKEGEGRQSRTFAKMCAGLGSMPERTDRREDDIVVMPDLGEEMAKIAATHGLPLPALTGQAPAAPSPDEASGAPAAPAAEAGPPCGGEPEAVQGLGAAETEASDEACAAPAAPRDASLCD